MAIIQAPAGCCDLKPFNSSSIPIRNGIPSLSSSSIKIAHFSLNNTRKNLTTYCSFLDDSVSGSTVTALEIDPMLDVKKKAMEISPGLKGTSLYLVGINSTMKTRVGKLLADTLQYYYFDRSLLRHGISIWLDVPLDIIAKEIVEDGVRLIGTNISPSASHSEVVSQLAMIYEELQGGYAIADATISLQNIAGLLGYDDVEAVSTEDMGLEVLTELEKLMRVKKMMEEAGRPF